MTRKATTAANTDWETISTGGFPPMWKPDKDGEFILFRPVDTDIIKGSKGKKGRKDNPSVKGLMLGGDSDSFYIKDDKQIVDPGGEIIIPLSFNLEGEDKLAVRLVEDEPETRLSTLSVYILENNLMLKIIFNGKVKGGQGTVKRFTIQAPKGAKEILARTKQKLAIKSGKSK